MKSINFFRILLLFVFVFLFIDATRAANFTVNNNADTSAAVASGDNIFVAMFYAPASTLTVTNTNDSGAGSLRDAFAQANAAIADDIINFNIPASNPNCTASGVCTITLTTGELSLDPTYVAGKVTITNASGASKLLISGNNNSRVFYVNMNANLTLDGVTITNGNGAGTNFTGNGGGIYIYFNGVLNLMNSIVSGNTTAQFKGGGGLENYGGTLNMTNSTVSNNTSDNGGGGIVNVGALNITNSTINNNTALGINGEGGGIEDNTGVSLKITNSTLSGNTAGMSGGAIWTYGDSVYLTNVTITKNRSANTTNCFQCGGGGIYYNGGGAVSMINTIVAGNTVDDNFSAPDFFGAVFSSNSSNNILGNNQFTTGITDGTNGNQVGTNGSPINARLAPLGNYGGATMTHALLSNSTAINNGNNCVLTTNACNNSNIAFNTDQRGIARIGNVDIGAFEVSSALAPLPIGKKNIPYNLVISQYDNIAGSYTFSATGLPPNLSLAQNFAFAPEAIITIAITGTPTVTGNFTPTITITDGNGNTATINYSLVIAGPTAASVTIGGRVLNARGRGIFRAVVQLTDMNGETRTRMSNPFGYYRFDNVAAGETYILNASAKGYTFAPRVVSVTEDLTDMNFTVEP